MPDKSTNRDLKTIMERIEWLGETWMKMTGLDWATTAMDFIDIQHSAERMARDIEKLKEENKELQDYKEKYKDLCNRVFPSTSGKRKEGE